MNKYTLNAVHDDELLLLIDNLGLRDKLDQGKLKCKFTGETITFENLYSIFPESGDIKFVSDNPEAVKLFTEYVNEYRVKRI